MRFAYLLIAALIPVVGAFFLLNRKESPPSSVGEKSAKSVPEATTKEAGGPGSKVGPEVLAFFEALRVAFLNQELDPIAELFSFEAMVDQAEQLGFLDLREFSDADQAAVRRTLVNNFADGLLQMARANRWELVEVLGVEDLGADRLVAYFRARSADGSHWGKYRWWLVKEADGQWRSYDYEEASQSLRASIMIGTAGSSLLKEPPTWVADLNLMIGAFGKLNTPSRASATREIFQATGSILELDGIPQGLEVFVRSARASAMLHTGNFSRAFDDLNTIDQLTGGSPANDFQLGHYYAGRGKIPEAIASYKKYAEVLGWDVTTHEPIAACYYRIGDIDQAAAHARKGLADNPQAHGCLVTLSLVLPHDQLGEIAEHLARLEQKEAGYRSLLRTSFKFDKDALLDHVLALLKEDIPDSPLINDYELPTPNTSDQN
jgi:tetratricopeptide (TPR) repeat protein